MDQFGIRQLWISVARIVCQRSFTVRPVRSRRMQIRSDVINVYAPREEFF